MFTKPSRVGKVSSSLTNLLSVSENALHESYQQFWLLGETNLWEALTGNRKEGRRNFRTFICSVGHIPQPENQSSFQAAFSIQLPLSFSLVVFSHKVVSKSCMTPQTVPARFLCPWAFSRQEYRRGFLLQHIFPTQRSNPGFLHCRQISLPLSHLESSLSFYSIPQIVPPLALWGIGMIRTSCCY